MSQIPEISERTESEQESYLFESHHTLNTQYTNQNNGQSQSTVSSDRKIPEMKTLEMELDMLVGSREFLEMMLKSNKGIDNCNFPNNLMKFFRLFKHAKHPHSNLNVDFKETIETYEDVSSKMTPYIPHLEKSRDPQYGKIKERLLENYYFAHNFVNIYKKELQPNKISFQEFKRRIAEPINNSSVSISDEMSSLKFS